MSLSQETMLDLMAYADGELEGAARARVEALVRSSDEARRILDAMDTLGDAVRDAEEGRPELAHADAIADAVMKRVADSATAPNVASLAEARDAKRSRVGTAAAIAGVLALAASAILMLRANMEKSAELAHHAAHAHPSESGGAHPEEIGPLPGTAVASAASVSGVDVEQVESPSHQVSVFYLPAVSATAANSQASSVVVWIGDDNGGH